MIVLSSSLSEVYEANKDVIHECIQESVNYTLKEMGSEAFVAAVRGRDNKDQYGTVSKHSRERKGAS